MGSAFFCDAEDDQPQDRACGIQHHIYLSARNPLWGDKPDSAVVRASNFFISILYCHVIYFS